MGTQRIYRYTIFMGIFIIIVLILSILNYMGSYSPSVEDKIKKDLIYLNKIGVKTYIIDEKNINLLKYSNVNSSNVGKNTLFQCPILANWKDCYPKYNYILIKLNGSYIAACKDKYSYKKCISGNSFFDLVEKIKNREIEKLVKNVE